MDDESTPPEPGELTGWKAVFVELLRDSPNVTAAAAGAGVNRQYAYEARKADPAFAALWDDAIEESVDELEAAVFRSAVEDLGGEKRVVTNVQARLAELLLKAHRSARYRDKVSTEHTGEVKVTVRYADELDAIAGGGDRPPEAPPGPGPDPPV